MDGRVGESAGLFLKTYQYENCSTGPYCMANAPTEI